MTRTLPIDGALLGDVLLRLRRDCAAEALRWSLGNRGVAEVDVAFTGPSAGSPTGPSWTTTARLWSDTGLAVTTAIVRCVVTGADEVRLTLEPAAPPAAGEIRMPGLDELARAALDELAEELLWHATRAGITHRR